MIKVWFSNDEPINNVNANDDELIEIKKPLLSKAKNNLNHFSKSNMK